ncbi:cephalosporin hydroxylase [Bradyrhizobium sp. USDA 4524]|uniref:CmcI family methyltransferase n=1 Tax=unclassified Bradyrhizobium TaxID=2631580 RepID=UPI0020A07E7D|nr:MULTISPECIES: CmcI family methyltransferase [unclassified Bradyrhizobium]MCP1838442.1 cephalosporin hydroxylase [Bradyrhizobium sp. USDA 4538]MCP1899006.1 cephalosporin hydroxylase [Bradyrhizobium sp. USDA 4537]MCP1986880.1 cephalosporin hydroxylase [Bradyrhizobium sp. USDA 4539]
MKLASGYKAFWEGRRKNHPDETNPSGLLGQGGIFDAIDGIVNGDHSDRFARPSQRIWRSSIYPWSFPNSSTTVGALALTYKGLITIKPPFDLALYTRLIWELQPRTIIELGSFQGGSALWFADQMSVLCENPGEVHSFDLHISRIHQDAKHPLLTFHQVDLLEVETLDRSLLMGLSHPWLVIDDAHVQVFSVFSYLRHFLMSGDYYVIEDVPIDANKEIIDGFQLVEQSGFLVDTYYTDAFGTNLTCAPNAWLRKS